MEMHNSDTFSKSFDYASGKTGDRFQNPLWRITEIFFGSRFRKSVANVKDFGAEIVENAVNARQMTKPSITHTTRPGPFAIHDISGSLINSLLDTIDNHQMVADAALNYLSAGKFIIQHIV